MNVSLFGENATTRSTTAACRSGLRVAICVPYASQNGMYKE